MTSVGGQTGFRWKQPEYVGENRCLPCTVVNLVIGAVAAIGAGTLWVPLGVLVAVGSVTAIYFRGYLVPGTPTLTKRYLPDAVLRLFDTHEDGRESPLMSAHEAADVEAFLCDVDALIPCRGDDLCLTPAFRERWHDRLRENRLEARDADQSATDSLFDGLDSAALFDGLDLDAESIALEARPNAFVAVVDETVLGQWESESAFRADVAADAELRARSSAWGDLPYESRMEVLGALRLWLDRCPACDGLVALDESVVESCCRSIDVVAATCDDCGTRLFEAQLPPGGLDAK